MPIGLRGVERIKSKLISNNESTDRVLCEIIKMQLCHSIYGHKGWLDSAIISNTYKTWGLCRCWFLAIAVKLVFTN